MWKQVIPKAGPSTCLLRQTDERGVGRLRSRFRGRVGALELCNVTASVRRNPA